MAVYNITYHTENFYTKPVRKAVIELMVLPENSNNQRCITFDILNSLDVVSQYSESLYGARLIRFQVPSKFCSFEVTVTSTVEKDDVNPFDFTGISQEEQWMIIENEHFKIDYFRYLSTNAFTAPVRGILPIEIIRAKQENLFSFMQRINEWIHGFIFYQVGVTTTRTTLDELLEIKTGVCQDQAHLFIAIMRANGIPARYVSGYLNQGSSYTGNIAMHAWAEAFLPGTGWIGFDPSNNLLADVNYIKVGHGLDYTDCMPIRGIIIAKGTGTTHYKVTIAEQSNQ